MSSKHVRQTSAIVTASHQMIAMISPDVAHA